MNTLQFDKPHNVDDWQPVPTSFEQVPYDASIEYPLESAAQRVANVYYQSAHTLPQYRLMPVNPDDTRAWYEYTIEEIAGAIYEFVDANILHYSMALLLLAVTYLLISSR